METGANSGMQSNAMAHGSAPQNSHAKRVRVDRELARVSGLKAGHQSKKSPQQAGPEGGY